MCLAKAYLHKGEEEQLLMEDVASLKIEGKKLLLRTLFGEKREVDARLKEVDFQNASIVMEGEAGR